ncbi:MAG: tripartite tricarboxylate transporter TctB family protein [Deltaproteobacteria bacterium]|nr:tripartite tricarboxylate transporter TctB family protein [Deltaproteobacteria bacterium]
MSSATPGPSSGEPRARRLGAIRDAKDFWSGVMCMGFALAAIVLGRGYPLGSPASMGPGMFPMILGGCLGLLGLVCSLRAMRPRKPVAHIARIQPRPVLLVLASVVAYGVTLPKAGLVVASMLLVIISRLAAPGFRWLEVTVFGAILTLGCVLVFVVGLKMPVPIWPLFLGG